MCRIAREDMSERWPASTAHILQRLVMFAVNTGIWTATFAVLALILVRIVRSLLASLSACFYFYLLRHDTNTIDVRLSINSDHCGVRHLT